MKPRIAISEPTSSNPEYNQRSLPQYVNSIEAEGGEAVVIPSKATPHEIAKLVTSCEGVAPESVRPAGSPFLTKSANICRKSRIVILPSGERERTNSVAASVTKPA